MLDLQMGLFRVSCCRLDMPWAGRGMLRSEGGQTYRSDTLLNTSNTLLQRQIFHV